jgi:hypothetical protein
MSIFRTAGSYSIATIVCFAGLVFPLPAQVETPLSVIVVGAVPPDTHEPVTGAVQVASSPADHAAALYLLERARQNSLTHGRGMQPFHFTASFTAVGAADNGAGELTEIWMNGQKWRWTANLGNLSVARTSYRGRLVENVHVDAIPMRAHVLRNEIYWATDEYTVKAQLRTAQIQWNGKPATCILASGVTGAATQIQGRIWQEEEYCVDNTSGLLMMHSIAPGTFAVFGYSANQQFHGRTMPDRITVYVASTLAADASFGITDATSGDDAAIASGSDPVSNEHVVGIQMPARFAIVAPTGVGKSQSVMIHANVNGDGKVVEEEVSATGDSSLSQAALDLVKGTDFGPTATQRQMYLNIVFR